MKAETVGKFVVVFVVWAITLTVINAFVGSGFVMFVAVGLCGAWLWEKGGTLLNDKG